MKKLLIATATTALIAGGLYATGLLPFASSPSTFASPGEPGGPKAKGPTTGSGSREEPAPAVTVVRAARAPLRETVLVTGTLVPRLEVLVAPEVEGLRVIELLAEEGDSVARGQVLAALEQETLRAQLAQNDAALAKANAAITQARSNIVAAEARQVETGNAWDRAKPLSKSGVLSDSILDQREAAARSAAAQLKVAQDGLLVAEAEKAQVQAQRRDLDWRLSRTEVRAPVAGLISRRNARMGGVASGSAVAQPMFVIITAGEIELEAEVPEADMARLRAGQKAVISTAGTGEVKGTVRLVNPEVDRSTRLGRVRITLAPSRELRIGSFGRGTVEVRTGEGTMLPASAVLFGSEGAFAQVVGKDNRVVSRKVETGLQTTEIVEIVSGVEPGDLVVARSGTFLRTGDLVSPVQASSGLAKSN